MKIAYIHGKIFNQKNDAFIVEDGIFKAFGKTSTILNKPIDKIIDLNHHYVFPGFHDSHMHVLGLGQSLRMMNLSKYRSIDDLIEAAKKHPDNPLVGRGFHESQTPEKRSLTKEDLNRISTDIPIIFYRVCGHMLMVNDQAITIAKKLNPNLPKDASSFDLALGHFKEDAMQWILNIQSQTTKENIKAEILSAQKYLLSNGVTAVGSDDFSMYHVPYETIFEVLQELDQQGTLKIRIYEQANLPNIEDLNRFIKNNHHNYRGNHLRMGCLKLFADGSLGARSAALTKPYSDQDTLGILIFEPHVLKTYIKLANDNSMDVAIHAIGDYTVDVICDAIESILEEERINRRHSIIHAQLARPDQIERMKLLNIGAQTQPIFINSDLEIIPSRLGERMNQSYLFYSMHTSGVKTTISTDAPVEDPNPLENLFTAITRKSIKRPDLGPYLTEEAFPFKEAVRAYTEIPPYFSYQENELGKLMTNHKADFVIVDHIDETNPDSLLKAKVLRTFIDGEIVYQNT